MTGNWKIPLFKIYWDEDDVQAVSKVIRRGTYWAAGPEIEIFERKISKYINAKYCVTFNSGTSALHAVLLAHGVGKNDEIIVPSFTFIATVNAPLFVGARPIFADIEEKTLGLDPADVEKKITKRTKAIIAVHYGGCPCQIKELRKIADEHGLILIEDAAEAFGAMISRKKVGTFGDSAIFSFCQNKIISTGEGGAVVTNSKEIYEKLKLIRSHGRLETRDYFSTTETPKYVTLGYNLRISSIAAALGISQISKIKKLIALRRKVASEYEKYLGEVKELILPNPPHGFYHVYQMYSIRVKKGRKFRDKLMKYLNRNGIMSKIFFEPVHLTEFYKLKFGRERLPITEKVSEEILSLPMYPSLTEKEINYITAKIRTLFKEFE